MDPIVFKFDPDFKYSFNFTKSISKSNISFNLEKFKNKYDPNYVFDFKQFSDEIFYKIIGYSLSIKECDINFNLNLKLVNKYWYSKINTIRFWKEYSKYVRCLIPTYLNDGWSLGNSLFSNFDETLKQSILNHKLNTSNTKLLNTKILLETQLYNRNTYTKEKILKTHNLVNLHKHINDDLFYLFEFDINNIPVCYFKNSKCIDNLCSHQCAANYHGLLDYCNHYLMRGIDNKGRFYLLLFYKNNKTNEIYYEFLYNIKLRKNNRQYNIFTYSGYQNNCYIGNLSFILNPYMPTNINHFKREINEDSYDYLYKLINYDNTGEVYFDNRYQTYKESNNLTYNHQSIVTLYFKKEDIEKQIKKNLIRNKYLFQI